jgi:hypothetical protein
VVHIVRAVALLDVLKFLLQIAWEAKFVSHGKYGELSTALDEIGKMLGGWKKGLETKTPN